MLFWLLACRPLGETPDRTGVKHVEFPEDTGDTAGACHNRSDADADGWQVPEVGGHDCDDHDGNVGNCDSVQEDSGLSGCEAAQESCNGLDDDCDGRVDDALALEIFGVARAVVAGNVLEGGQLGFAVGVNTGAADGAVSVYDTAGTLVVRIDGAGQSASFGSQLGTGRDLTGDGVVDLVIAAPNAETADGPNSGRVFVLPGPIGPETTVESAVGWFEGGELDGQPGRELALLPDMTGDGKAELAIGYYRHVLLFSGAPAKGVRKSAAFADVEMNTGGGPWHFASWPSGITPPGAAAPLADDGFPDLLLGMETFNGGAGVMATFDSATRKIVSSFSSDLHPGLGAKLVAAGGEAWSLSAGTPVRLSDLATLPVAATSLAESGTLGGGLLVADGSQFWLVGPALSLEGPFPAPATPQPSRGLTVPDDVDGDGLSDPVMIGEESVFALASATLFDRCDADGDETSAAAGDCDDENASVAPLATDACDGVDEDCSGESTVLVDAERTEASGAVAVALLSSEDGAWLDSTGTTFGFGAYSGQSWTGLQGGQTAALAASGASANGVWLLAHADAADMVLNPTQSGVAADGATATFLDGTGLSRTGELGPAGDSNGDGGAEVWLLYADTQGHRSVALFAINPGEARNADNADVLIRLPDGWTDARVAPVPKIGSSDLDGDGRDDLLVASPSSYYGWGRASVFANLAEGDHDGDQAALVGLYGEPGEALGSAVAVGGDFDHDGVGDGALASSAGTRILHGGACPMFADRLEESAESLAFVDLVASGTAQLLGLSEGVLSRDGEATRHADKVFGSTATALAYRNQGHTYILTGDCDE